MFHLTPNTPVYAFDDSWIAQQKRTVRRWMPAVLADEPAIVADRNWESQSLSLYGSVISRPAGGYRLYYMIWAPGRHRPMVLAAESDNGLHWSKPDLGIIDFKGSRNNNIVLLPDRHLDSASVMHDPDDSQRPYKMMAFRATDPGDFWAKDWGLYPYFSADGLNWREAENLILRAGDRTSVCEGKYDGKYVAYTRHSEMMQRVGARSIFRSESADFAQWSEPELVLSPDLLDEPGIEYYGVAVFRRHNWYFGLIEYWDSRVDRINIHLAVSRDGKQWMRPAPRQPFIDNGSVWNRAWTSSASSGPVIVKEQMVFYVGGRNYAHGFDSVRQHGAIGYASLPLDRFCALEGGSEFQPIPGVTVNSQVTTVPLRWPGGQLLVNADTRQSFDSHPLIADGEIGIEILDADERPIPGWSGESRAIFRGNTHCRTVLWRGPLTWPKGANMDAFKDQTIRIRFHLRSARLFAFEAAT